MPLLSVNGLDVLVLSGSPSEMGREHGRLLGERLRHAVVRYLHQSRKAFGVPFEALVAGARQCEAFIPVEYREEMSALAEAAGVSYDEVLALNCLVDVDAALTSQSCHCCNFVLGPPVTLDGLFLHGRNLDFPHLGVLPGIAVVIVRRPSMPGAVATVTVSWAGCVGILTGANRQKLSMAEVGTHYPAATLLGMPLSFMIRKALEECGGLGAVHTLVEATARTCGVNIAVADGNTRTACALECTPQLVERRDMQRGKLVVDDVCLCAKTTRDRLCHPAGAFRHARMVQLIGEHAGTIDLETALEFLRDRYDAARGERRGRGYHCICNAHTVHSVLFLPEQEEMLLAHGKTPAPGGGYRHLFLKSLW